MGGYQERLAKVRPFSKQRGAMRLDNISETSDVFGTKLMDSIDL